MKAFWVSIILVLIAFASAKALDPVRAAVKYTGGEAVAVEVQLYDFGTSTNVYPGAGNQSMGNLTANGSGIISFAVGKGDGVWAAITPASVTQNYMLIVYVGGSVAAYLRLDQLQLEQGIYGSSIDPETIDLADGQILIGNASDEAQARTVTGDGSLANDGALTVTGLQGRAVADIAPTAGQSLAWNNAQSRWEPIDVDGTALLNQENTWTETQTFQDASGLERFGVISKNSHIILTNDNNSAQQLRFYEPSLSGSNYVSFESPALTTSSTEYILPDEMGNVGEVLSIIAEVGNVATLDWVPFLPPLDLVPGGVSGMSATYVQKITNQTVSSTTLQDDDELILKWGSNSGIYLIEGTLFIADNPIGGVKLNFTTIGTGKPKYARYFEHGEQVKEINTDIIYSSVGSTGAVIFQIVVDSPADVIGMKLRFAQATYGQSVTIGEGSFMSFTRID